MKIETQKIPTTLAELEALGEDVMLHIPASFEEYLEWVEKCQFTIEYFNNEIVIMGNASYYHEKLVAEIIFCLKTVFNRISGFSVLGSNIKIHIADVLSPTDFNADVSVVQGEPEFVTLPSGKKSTSTITNPVLVVEVTSKSTISHDFGDKLLAYKKIDSLQYAIFVSQYQPFVTVYERKGIHHWELRDYTRLEDSFSIMEQPLTLAEIYKDIQFEN
ncbi:Uma2 family endonuclease [Runella aurantiaca]|uniref:Uma2 family endonuclease n=1 Tax=Runella aurantiaca TaxID=2282308 RepID=A0A369ID43_9BACT|nr:Uma2 family endonuclease [Runella aurantiaca]RDB04576.1 Uma2 family endonuclease [Runella aurantiaca]